MKKYIPAIILFTLCVNIYSVDYWLRVPSPTTKWLTKSFFIDSVYGWAAGDSGAMIHSSNGGASWNVQNSGITIFPIDDIFFTSRKNGWGLVNDYFSFGTIILRTTNGGQTWTNYRFYDTTIALNTVYFLDSLTGFLGGVSGKIFKTINGGANWNEVYIDTNYCPILYRFPKRDFTFLNAQTGYCCGGQIDIQGMIWKTTNGGAHWFTYCVTPEPLEDIKAISSTKIMAAGGDFEYGAITATTYDGGTNWLYDTTGLFGVGKSLAFRTPSELWVPLSFSQQWALSLDSGSIAGQWRAIPAPDSTSVYSAVFLSPTNGWAFGSYGAIMKYNTSIIGISGYGGNIPLAYSLKQNYPNPFNPSTVISYELAKPEFVKIAIYDLLGKQVKMFTEGIRPEGMNHFKFVNRDLASGVYIYRIEAGTFTESKKMVIVK